MFNQNKNGFKTWLRDLCFFLIVTICHNSLNIKIYKLNILNAYGQRHNSKSINAIAKTTWEENVLFDETEYILRANFSLRKVLTSKFPHVFSGIYNLTLVHCNLTWQQLWCYLNCDILLLQGNGNSNSRVLGALLKAVAGRYLVVWLQMIYYLSNFINALHSSTLNFPYSLLLEQVATQKSFVPLGESWFLVTTLRFVVTF